MIPCNAVIIGTGGHAQVIWSAWKAAKAQNVNYPVNVVAWLEKSDYAGPDFYFDLPVYRDTEEGWATLHRQEIIHCYLGIGMVKAAPQRWRTIEQLARKGLKPLTLVHPAAVVSPDAVLEDGCFVGARAVVQPFSTVGRASIINTGAIVEHHAQVGYNTHIAPGAVLCGDVHVGNHGMIGAGSVVIQQISIGDETTIGAGSVVIQNIPSRAIAFGNPALPIRAEQPSIKVKS